MSVNQGRQVLGESPGTVSCGAVIVTWMISRVNVAECQIPERIQSSLECKIQCLSQLNGKADSISIGTLSVVGRIMAGPAGPIAAVAIVTLIIGIEVK